jgi:Leucine-rich repeat (LRR) protein
LRLYGNQLSGAIPVELGNLSNLSELDLDGNQLTGSIPAGIGNLSSLVFLYLGNNLLTGSIPPEIGNLSNLRSLGLEGNQLNGSIPAELGNLAKLEFLYSWNNSLTGPVPPELANASSLIVFYFDNNQLSGSIPAELGTLSNLQDMSFFNNQMSGTIPPELGDLAFLNYLDLDSNQFSGIIPPELGNLSNLTFLWIGRNQLTGPIPVELGSLSKLQILDLAINQLSGNIPIQFDNLTGLVEFSLRENQLTGSIPAGIGNFSNLRSFDISSNHLSGSIPSELGDLSSLEDIRLEENQLTGEVPDEFLDLTSLVSGSLSFGFNGLFTNNPALDAFLDLKSNTDWSLTQTVAPELLSVLSSGSNSATVHLAPIEYQADPGRYTVRYGTSQGGPFNDSVSSTDKAQNSVIVDGLASGMAYYFVAHTETDAHANNLNAVVSDPGNEVSAVAGSFLSDSTSFESDTDFLTEPLDGTPFTTLEFSDGFDDTQDAVVYSLDSNLSNTGALTITTENATWLDDADDGLFLGSDMTPSFIVELTVSGLEPLQGNGVGLMVRIAPGNDLEAGGPGQDYVAVGVENDISQIVLLNTDDGVTTRQVQTAAADTPSGITALTALSD